MGSSPKFLQGKPYLNHFEGLKGSRGKGQEEGQGMGEGLPKFLLEGLIRPFKGRYKAL